MRVSTGCAPGIAAATYGTIWATPNMTITKVALATGVGTSCQVERNVQLEGIGAECDGHRWYGILSNPATPVALGMKRLQVRSESNAPK